MQEINQSSYLKHLKYLKIAIIIAVLANTFIHFFAFPTIKGNEKGADTWETLNFDLKKDFSKSINVDEREMARVAFYYLEGKGFVTDVSFGRPAFRKDTLFKSAFRPKFNIFLHILGLKIYGKAEIKTAQNIPENYFYCYAFFLAIIKIMFFAFSVFAFLKITRCLFEEKLALFTTFLYVVYPPILLYINVFTILENISLSLLIISVAPIVLLLKTKQLSSKNIALSAILALLACLIRPHIVVIFLLILIFLFACSIYLKNKTIFKYVFVCGLTILVGHLPIFYQNYQDFGKIFLSTQPSLEYFQGHNEYARGSWQPGIWSKYEKELKPMFESEPNLPKLDEKQEMDFYNKQANNWIKANPSKEIMLIIRKTAIFFLPYNFMNHNVSIILTISFLGFLGFLGFALINIKSVMQKEYFLILLFLLLPFIGSYFLNIYFFIGERWRLYGEPFMLILAIYFYKNMILFVRHKIQKTNP